jgi:hypothetical protein
MENKKLYICGSGNSNEPCRKIYTSVKKLKSENSLWDELGIYEVKLSKINCVVEPDLFKSDDLNIHDHETSSPSEIDLNESNNLEAAKSFLAKVTQTFKKKTKLDWSDKDGNKEFKWHGTCDACGDKKTNLTVVHSATLSGIAICRECRTGVKIEQNEISKR